MHHNLRGSNGSSGESSIIPINDHVFNVYTASPDYVFKVAEELGNSYSIAKSIKIPTDYRVQLLDEMGSHLRGDTPFRKRVAGILSDITEKSVPLVTHELKQAGNLLSRSYIEEMIDRELGTKNHGGSEYLDGWVKEGDIYTRRMPLGLLFHNLAGNSEMVPVASYLFGTATKNNGIMKVSGDEPYLAFEMQKLLEQIEGGRGDVSGGFKVFYWPGEQTTTLYQPLFSKIDGVVHWGGAESTKAIGKIAAENNVKLISHGPMISFEVIENVDHANLHDTAMNVAIDSSMGDQRECHSSRLVFFRNRNGISTDAFAKEVLGSMVEFNYIYPRKVDGGEYTKRQFYKSEGSQVYESDGMTVVVLNRKPRPIDIDMSKERFVVIAPFGDTAEIKDFVKRSNLKGHVQTMGFDGGYKGTGEDFRTEAALLGFSNITEPGQMADHAPGTAHDTMFNLKELTRVHTSQEDIYHGQKLKMLGLDLPTVDSKVS